MSGKYKRYFSLFLLGIFLFAYAEKGVHDILHLNDIHCHALDQKHYHNQEHHCYICDFNFSIFDGTGASLKAPSGSFQYNNSILFIEQQISVQPCTVSFDRGPPSLS